MSTVITRCNFVLNSEKAIVTDIKKVPRLTNCKRDDPFNESIIYFSPKILSQLPFNFNHDVCITSI